MGIAFAGSSVADFYMSGNAVAADLNTSASVLAPYVFEGIDLDDGRVFTSPIFAGVASFWASLYSKSWGDFSAPGELRFYDTSYSTTQPVFRVIQTGTFYTGWYDPVKIEAWNGSGWTTLATAVTSAASGLTKFDFQIVKDASAGAVRIYLGETLNVEVTGINTELVAWTSIDQIQFSLASTTGADSWIVSAIMIADETTIGLKMIQGTLVADGANTDWTGTYADINELGLDTADFITDNTVGHKQSFTDDLNAIIDSGHDIVASVLSLNMDIAGSTHRVGVGYRSGGVDYSTANDLLSIGPAIINKPQATDPNTAAAWTPANIEAAESFVELLAV